MIPTIIIVVLIALVIYLGIMVLYLNRKTKGKNSVPKTIVEDKIAKTVIITAKKKKDDLLPNIINRYIFDNKYEGREDSPDDNEEEEDVDLKFEVTVNDETLIMELEDNDQLSDIEQMQNLLKGMDSEGKKPIKQEVNNDPTEYEDSYQEIDDRLIDFIKTDFTKVNQDN